MTAMMRALGFLLIASPFIAITVCMVLLYGWMAPVIVWGAALAIVAPIVLGVLLATGGKAR